MAEKIIDLPYIEREAGEHTYRCDRLLLTDWIALEALLMRVFGVQILDMDEKNLGAYAPHAISASTGKDHEAVFELLGKCLRVRNEEGGWSMISRETQERWWAVYIGELPTVLGMFFEIQFKDFFSGLEKLLPAGKS